MDADTYYRELVSTFIDVGGQAIYGLSPVFYQRATIISQAHFWSYLKVVKDELLSIAVILDNICTCDPLSYRKTQRYTSILAGTIVSRNMNILRKYY